MRTIGYMGGGARCFIIYSSSFKFVQQMAEKNVCSHDTSLKICPRVENNFLFQLVLELKKKVC